MNVRTRLGAGITAGMLVALALGNSATADTRVSESRPAAVASTCTTGLSVTRTVSTGTNSTKCYTVALNGPITNVVRLASGTQSGGSSVKASNAAVGWIGLVPIAAGTSMSTNAWTITDIKP